MQLSDRTHELIPASEEIGLYGKKGASFVCRSKNAECTFLFLLVSKKQVLVFLYNFVREKYTAVEITA
jgi:hypothetical protein